MHKLLRLEAEAMRQDLPVRCRDGGAEDVVQKACLACTKSYVQMEHAWSPSTQEIE